MSKREITPPAPRQDLGSVVCAALLLAGAALIHSSVVRAHLDHWRPESMFFLALAMAEAYLAVGLVLWDSWSLYVATIALNLLTAGIWLWSRTVGLPLGPEAFQAESIGALDAICTAFELGACVLVATPLTHLLQGPDAPGA
jgi:hypothetical protein